MRAAAALRAPRDRAQHKFDPRSGCAPTPCAAPAAPWPPPTLPLTTREVVAAVPCPRLAAGEDNGSCSGRREHSILAAEVLHVLRRAAAPATACAEPPPPTRHRRPSSSGAPPSGLRVRLLPSSSSPPTVESGWQQQPNWLGAARSWACALHCRRGRRLCMPCSSPTLPRLHLLPRRRPVHPTASMR